MLFWSHYVLLSSSTKNEEKQFYEIEAINNDWFLRELQRQVNSALCERLFLSLVDKQVKELSKKEQILSNPKDAIKDPYILEFLELKDDSSYSENKLEKVIIDKLEHFLLELGKGFLFEARQKRFSVELTLPEDSNIYASKYQLYLPSKEDFIKQIEEAREEVSHYGQ